MGGCRDWQLENTDGIFPEDFVPGFGGQVEIVDELEVGSHTADGPIGSVEEVFGFAGVEDHFLDLLEHELFEVGMDVDDHG